MGGAHQDARVHPRERDERSAHEVRAGARGGAVPVDGRRARSRATPRRRDRCDRSPYRGSARVRRRSAQPSGAHGVAGRGRDREREALRGHTPASRCPHHAHTAEPGARGGDSARGPLRRGHPRRPPADRRGLVPDLAHRSRGGRARTGGLRPSQRRRPRGPGRAADGAPARRAKRRRGRRAAGGAARRRATSSSGCSSASRTSVPSRTRTRSSCARWRTRPRWA